MSTRLSHGVFVLLSCALLLVLPGSAFAGDKDKKATSRFALGAGPSLVRFDTKLKFTDKTTGDSFFLDPEGNLNLPALDSVTTLFFLYRIADKHFIGFSHFGVHRESVLFDRDFVSGDLTLSGKATLLDKTKFYTLTYGYSLFRDDRSRILLTAGINGMDLDYLFEAEGQITLGDQTWSGSLSEEATVFAPLPLIGLDFWYAFTPDWSLSTKVAFAAGNYQDVTAFIGETSVIAHYRINHWLGALMGITYFDANAKIEDDVDITEVSYGFSGLTLGFHVTL